MAKNPTKQNTSTYEDDATLWQTRYRLAYSNQLPMFKRFADWYDLMYAVITQKNMSLWRSKIFLPVLASKAWNLIAKFISLRPGFEVRVRENGIDSYDLGEDEDLEEKAYKATLKLEYDYDNPDMDRPIREKLLATLTDATVTGTGLAKVPWCSEKKTRYERPVNKDGSIDLNKEKVIESIEGYNDLIPVNIFNVFVAPSSHDLYNAPWIIIKEFKTLDQLRAVNDGKGVEVYKNLDQLEGARSTSDALAVYKKSRNKMTVQLDPVVSDKTVDLLEIFECYDKATNKIKTYVNAGGTSNTGTNWVEIRSDDNQYWHGKYPLVRFTVKQRPYDFWGEGIFETNHTMQMAMNDVFNHYMDNWNLSVDGMLMAQESAGINDYIVEPGGLITYRTEEPKQFKFPEPNPASLNTVMNELMSNIEQNTISQYSTGSPDSPTDKTRGTKGGIEALQQAADDIVAFMRTNFQESIKIVGEMWMSNNQQFMIKPLSVAVPGAQGSTSKVTISPADIQGNMDLRVDEASMLPISDDQVKAQYSAFIQQLMQMQQASVAQHQMVGTEPITLKFGQIVEELAEKFGFRNVRAILDQLPPGPSPQQQQQQMENQLKTQEHQAKLQQMQAKTAQTAAQAQQTASGGQPQPTPQDKILEKVDYKDFPDDIKRQFEYKLGFQPSQTGVNSQVPHVQKANQDVLNMAQDLHAKGMLHPSVLDMVKGHMGQQINQPAPTPQPIGNPPLPPQEQQQALAAMQAAQQQQQGPAEEQGEGPESQQQEATEPQPVGGPTNGQ